MKSDSFPAPQILAMFLILLISTNQSCQNKENNSSVDEKSIAFNELYKTLTANGKLAFGPAIRQKKDHTEAMSIGLILSGILRNKGMITTNNFTVINKCVDWLINHWNTDPAGYKGWGLSYAWDAYNDGSVNPPYAVYNITTAICIEALTEYQQSGLVYRYAEVEFVLKEVCSDILARGYSSVRKMFFYSPRLEDHHFAHNVNMYMSLSLYKYSKYCEKKDSDYESAPVLDIIKSAAVNTWEDRINDRSGVPYFPYHHSSEWGRFSKRPNDLKHSMYTMRGLYFLKRQNLIQSGPTIEEVFRSILRFIAPENIYEMPDFKRKNNNADREARLWGIGMLLIFLDELISLETDGTLIRNLNSLRHKVIEILLDKYTEDQYTRWRFRPESELINLPRHLAHVFKGLSY